VTAFGKLYLIPVPISDAAPLRQIPEYNLELTRSLKNFIAEDAKTARRFLKIFSYPTIEQAEILVLNEHTKSGDVSILLKPLLNGEDMALMSDAGCPGIADPGAELVKLAHQKGIDVIPLVGPSSIVLSIMASGFNGQNFAFVGYLPIDKAQKIKRLKELEIFASKHFQAQFFIETPYRNEQLFETMLETLNPQTKIFVGKNIGEADQYLMSKTVLTWKKDARPALQKKPVVFGIFG